MKRMIFVSLIGLIVGFILCTSAFSLEPYDDFSVTPIDLNKWRSGEFIREIRDFGAGGRKLLLARSGVSPVSIDSYSDVQQNHFRFANPTSISSVQAEVTVLQSNITGSGDTRARIAGRWYNDGTVVDGVTGDIFAEIDIRGDPSGLRGWWYVGKYTGASDTTLIPLSSGYFTQSISSGFTYILSIAYNGANNFTFKIGDETKSYNGPARVGDAHGPWKALNVRTQIDNASSSCYVSATFDNVYTNGNLYDNFNDPSLTIDSSKWEAYEYVTEISGGKLRSKSRSSIASAPGTTINNALEIAYPLGIDTVQANVTPLAYQNPQGLFQVADITCAFYNDGSGTGGVIGDVVGWVAIGGSGTTPVATWRVYKYTSSDGSTSTVVKSGTFSTPVVLGNTYALYLHWSGSEFTFMFNNEVAYYKPETSILPAQRPYRRLRTAITPQVGKTEATIEALFDDVKVGYVVPNDNFSEAFIDEGKWKNGEMVREIDSDSHSLILAVASPNPIVSASFPYTIFDQLSFTNPDTVLSMKATVTLLDYELRNNAYTRIRLDGRWYNYGAGTPGTDMTGDIHGDISLREDPSGLYAQWNVARYTNSSGTTSNIAYGNFLTSIEVSTPYTLYIAYDSGANQFTFRVGGEEYTYVPSDYPRVRGPNSPWKSLTTRVQINDDESFGYVAAAFDNVYKNDTLYDNFSVSAIDQTKWSTYEFVREISGGEFRSKVRSGSASTGNINSSLESVYPSQIHSMRAKVTPTLYQNDHELEVLARIGGIFYHDGTSGSGYTGDVAAGVRIGGFGTTPEARWQVQRYTDDTGQNWEVLADGLFSTPIDLGNTYTLFMDWTGSQFTFQFENEVAHYTPTGTTDLPNIPNRSIGSRINHPDGSEAIVEAFYDNVIMNAPKVHVDPPSAEFNNVKVGTTADRTVTLSNPGDGWLEITNPVGPNPPFEVIDSSTCPDPPFTLDPGASCAIVVRFSPTAAGTFSGTVSVATNDPDQPTLTIPLHGTGVVPDIAVTPLDLVFGNVSVGTTKDLATTVKNEGTADLVLGTIGTVSAPFSRVAGPGACTDGQVLHPTESCTITIRFAPTSPGAFGPTPFTIPSDDPDENPVTVNLTGTGIVPDITIVSGDIDFGKILAGGSSSVQNVTIRNDGLGNLIIETVSLSDTTNFKINSDGCSGKTLVTSGNCVIGVSFTPGSVGTKTTTLSIPSNDPDEDPAIVHLSGKGVNFVVNPDQGTYGTQITITGSGFGSKKNKVLFGTVALKVVDWSLDGTTIHATVGKAMAPDTYDVTVVPKLPKGALPIVETKAFEVKGPEIDSIAPPSGHSDGITTVTIRGHFFSTKKGKVYLQNGTLTKACKVTAWGDTEITFVIPKKLPAGFYDVTVTNVVDSVTKTKGFEVN